MTEHLKHMPPQDIELLMYSLNAYAWWSEPEEDRDTWRDFMSDYDESTTTYNDEWKIKINQLNDKIAREYNSMLENCAMLNDAIYDNSLLIKITHAKIVRNIQIVIRGRIHLIDMVFSGNSPFTFGNFLARIDDAHHADTLEECYLWLMNLAVAREMARDNKWIFYNLRQRMIINDAAFYVRSKIRHHMKNMRESVSDDGHFIGVLHDE